VSKRSTFELDEKSATGKDESLEDSANLADPDVIAAEIVEDLQAALAQLKFARCPHPKEIRNPDNRAH